MPRNVFFKLKAGRLLMNTHKKTGLFWNTHIHMGYPGKHSFERTDDCMLMHVSCPHVCMCVYFYLCVCDCVFYIFPLGFRGKFLEITCVGFFLLGFTFFALAGCSVVMHFYEEYRPHRYKRKLKYKSFYLACHV